MKILWVLNKAIGKMAEEMRLPTDGYGGWLDQSLGEIRESDRISLAFLTSGNQAETKTIRDRNDVYYMIPGGSAYSSFRDNRKNRAAVKEVIDREKPDLIHLWGTESALGLLVARLTPDIPKVVYIQGFMNAVKRHYYESTSKKALRRATTFYDLVKRKTISKVENSIARKAENETEVLKRSDAIICDSDWCEAVCKAINSNLRVYRKRLPIDPIFKGTVRQESGSHRIFCASQYGPFKGFEVLLRAVGMVKQTYPDVCLAVPGGWNKPPVTLREKLTYDSYSNAMNRLIRELGLEQNVLNLGALTRAQMAEQMGKCEVFAQASTVENHSSTMREAMFAGVPCVASAVGSTAEYLQSGASGFLFRNTEPEVLAFYLLKLFADTDLQRKFGKAGKERIAERYAEPEPDYPTIYADLAKCGRKAVK